MRLIYLLIILLFQISCSEKQEEVTSAENFISNLVNNKSTYTAGEIAVLKFEIKGEAEVKLLLSNAFGTSTVLPEIETGAYLFTIPQNYMRKSGPCHWILLAHGKPINNGEFKIEPKTISMATLETYFGPRSITAGVQDFSMLICVTTDPFDNVFPTGTEVLFKSQFLSTISDFNIASKDLISWKNIDATKKSGRILVNTSFKEITSKELTTIVFPTLAESFLIEADRNHTFADGNQIMKFRTNVIRDKYDNIISDGTMVNFIIENTKGAILKTVAPSINGISKATMLHPSEKEEWKITAFVTGAAKSNAISLKFDTAISDFKVNFSDDNRIITAGPLESFMEQLVPDGILIQLDIYNDSGKYLETKKISSVKGYGIIELPAEYHPNGNYHLELKAAGIIKEFDVNLHE